MKALFIILLVSSLVYPALISGAASKSGYTENIVVEEIEMDTIEIDSIDYDAIEIDGDTIEDVVWAYEKCQWNPIRSKYDIYQQSLVTHPSFAKIAEKFQPKKRRF